MSAKRFDAKKKPSRIGEYNGDDPEDDEAPVAASEGEFPSLPDDDKRKKGTSSSGNRKNGSREASLPACQADECVADMSDAKRYYRRHKVCEVHAKAPAATVSGLRQRFCQQCSRFHELHEFDESKRSCRSRLEGHNERRRRSMGDYHGENSGSSRPESSQTRESQCWQPDGKGRIQILIPGNPAYRVIP
ncbi:hypothetical protein MLD38_002281 [Melastoma candidum]|uniref:Uncharacterized protein n=1 Tax=Melastoma candidum TaxID=119954 RepID=A0ACB9SKV5_9MYRT|nr:hypothetical protein MLD38_002281 [Melastoma candidum]